MLELISRALEFSPERWSSCQDKYFCEERIWSTQKLILPSEAILPSEGSTVELHVKSDASLVGFNCYS